MITAYFSGDKIFSNSEEAFSLYEKSCFGEKKESRIEYALFEALFLVRERKMQVLSGKKIIHLDSLIKKLRKIDKKLETKFTVYCDLRKAGYIVKTALKFGAEFRVYEKGIHPGEDHARWILYTSKEHDQLSWHDFAAKNRIAHSTKKNLLIAVVDEEGDVSYYEVSWIKP
ncbi:MAG: tRNA-intron lyase [Nanoarchaeota archaeon]|nr:tRNA-intron lyase [Nanoarchaeota archaeon]